MMWSKHLPHAGGTHVDELQVMSRPAEGLWREGGALQVWMAVLMVRRYSGWGWNTGCVLPPRGQGRVWQESRA